MSTNSVSMCAPFLWQLACCGTSSHRCCPTTAKEAKGNGAKKKSTASIQDRRVVLAAEPGNLYQGLLMIVQLARYFQVFSHKQMILLGCSKHHIQWESINSWQHRTSQPGSCIDTSHDDLKDMGSCKPQADRSRSSSEMQVKGESMNHTVDPRKSLRQVFTAVKADETELNIADSVSLFYTFCSAFCGI